MREKGPHLLSRTGIATISAVGLLSFEALHTPNANAGGGGCAEKMIEYPGEPCPTATIDYSRQQRAGVDPGLIAVAGVWGVTIGSILGRKFK